MGLWPVCFLLIFTYFFGHEKYSVYAVNTLGDERNVGTVLFDRSSLSNHCWTNEEFVILSSRKMFQDLLPKVEALNIQTDQYIADLLSYFHLCLEHVSNMSVGKTKHLMLRSLSDTMGGYLQSYVLPITKVSFYAGTVKYCNTEKTFELLVELKDFLHTNGAGWKNPMEMEMFINVTPIVVSVRDASAACDTLIVDPAIVRKRRSRRSITRRRRRARLKRKRSAPQFYDNKGESNNHNQESPRIFLPYLDDGIKPNSIALPFKDHNLWSLYEEESVDVLSRYYETCVNCLTSAENREKILANFNRDFYQWLLQSVYPRLNDDKWYPAFGGVLRIIAFLKDSVENEARNSVIMTTTSTTTQKNVEVVVTTSKSIEEVDGTGSFGTTELIIIAVSSAALIWILVGLSLVCYRYLRKHSDECSPCDSPRSDVAMLYKNDGFCDLDTCPSIISRKSVGEKVKDWWRQKFKTCPGGCDRTLEKERYLAAYEYKSKESLCSNKSRRSYKRRKKKVRSVSVSVSPSSSPCGPYKSKKFFYSSDISSSNSDSSYR